MATYRKVSRLIPSGERHQVITDVVAGDEIDLVDVLGRPARRLKIVPDDATDSIDIRLNNRVKIKQYYQGSGWPENGYAKPETVYVVSEGEQHPLYTLTGDEQYLTEEELKISFIQIDDITFGSGGTSITIYCW